MVPIESVDPTVVVFSVLVYVYGARVRTAPRTCVNGANDEWYALRTLSLLRDMPVRPPPTYVRTYVVCMHLESNHA